MVFVLVNILFTTYLAQIQSTIPLYLTNFVAGGGFPPKSLAAYLPGTLSLRTLCQLPMARFLNRFSRPQALTLSISLWGLGFLLIWLTGTLSTGALWGAILALSIMAIATVAYMPSASAFVVDIAPASLRGVYLSINSQC
uniref:Uncharacterized protein n=1 Tax=Desertifilum tharense IPPAS B-1220 TaxID=1781255 RepID=A0ACD5GRI4_9CYAN